MPTLHRSGGNAQVITKDGEVTLNINLSIDLNLKDLAGLENTLSSLGKGDGKISFSGAPKKSDDDAVQYQIPDFGNMKKERVKFGKDA
jgi:hypothetical protein